jgi:hypothetical protein
MLFTLSYAYRGTVDISEIFEMMSEEGKRRRQLTGRICMARTLILARASSCGGSSLPFQLTSSAGMNKKPKHCHRAGLRKPFYLPLK